jgi:hypothetical protein
MTLLDGTRGEAVVRSMIFFAWAMVMINAAGRNVKRFIVFEV